MDKCAKCNAEMRPQAKFCSRCGAARAQAHMSDTAGGVPRSNGVPPVTDIYKQAVMKASLIFWPNVGLTRILERPVDPAPSSREASNPALAFPGEDNIPDTPLPDEADEQDLPLLPEDDIPGMLLPEEAGGENPALQQEIDLPDTPLSKEAGELAPEALENGRIPGALLPEEFVSADLLLPEEVGAANDALSPVVSLEIAPARDYEPVLDAMEHLLFILDEHKAAEYQQYIANARQKRPDGKLITMCLYVYQQVFKIYKNRQTGRYLSHDDFEFVFVLAQYIIRKREARLRYAPDSTTRQKAKEALIDAKKNLVVLDTLCKLRARHHMPADLVLHARTQFMREQSASPMVKALWKDIAWIVASYLKEQHEANNLIPEIARDWVDEYHDLNPLEENSYKALRSAALLHYPLGFLTRSERVNLFDHIRNSRLKQIGKLLHDRQSELLAVLSEALDDPSFSQVYPPRGFIPLISRGGVELMPEINRLLATGRIGSALRLLEEALGDHLATEYAPMLREWRIYIRARANGLPQTIEEWQQDVREEVASWEEVWNLAVALKDIDIARALQALRPGVELGRAPFSHLRFALFCAVTMLKSAEGNPEATTEVETFLLHALLKLPDPLAYLTWLLLANRTSAVIDPRQQHPVFKVFQDMLDHAITYHPPARTAREVSIEDVERDFQRLLTLAESLEQDYVLEPAQKSITIKNKKSGISARVSCSRQRVAIFVDYENLIFSLPEEMQQQSEMIARTLRDYAEGRGTVVQRWMCYSPANIRNGNLYSVQHAFQKAGFKLEIPRGLTERTSSEEKRDQADPVLIECITAAMTENEPDVYIIVSGDHIYYERVRRLLEQGKSVRIVSYKGVGENKLSGKYSRLLDVIQQAHMPEEFGEFTIDNIRDIFHLTDEQVTALDTEIGRRHEEKSNKV